jgi:thiol-disulfide isomerase/thioredoxin
MNLMKSLAAIALIAFGLPALAGDLSGRRAPSFALPDVQMKYHDILDYRGKVVIIEVMQTSCEHCQKLAPTLEKIKAKYGEKIAVLALVNPPDTLATVSDFIARYKSKSTYLFDCGQVSAIYMKASPTNPSIQLPHLFVIDAAGMIREDFGVTDANKAIFEGDGLSPVLDKVLAAAPAAPAKK